jgi:hypothetical protein
LCDQTKTNINGVCFRNIAHFRAGRPPRARSILETHSLPDETPGRGRGSHFSGRFPARFVVRRRGAGDPQTPPFAKIKLGLTMTAITARRLLARRLIGEPFASPAVSRVHPRG